MRGQAPHDQVQPEREALVAVALGEHRDERQRGREAVGRQRQLFDAGDALGAIEAVLWTAAALVLLTAALAFLLPRRARAEDAAA